MKPFDLKAAKKGAMIVTRAGYSASILSFKGKGKRKVVAMIYFGGIKEKKEYPTNGIFLESGEESNLDLMMLTNRLGNYYYFPMPSHAGMMLEYYRMREFLKGVDGVPHDVCRFIKKARDTEPFDIEAARRGMKVITKDGWYVRFFPGSFSDPDKIECLIGPALHEQRVIYRTDGSSLFSKEHDLVMLVDKEGNYVRSYEE